MHVGTEKYMLSECKVHGETNFIRSDITGNYKCVKCRSERTMKSCKKKIRTLVEEHGGKCAQCGYDKSEKALHFHHRDPENKSFRISEGAARGMALAKLRAEA